MGGGGVGAIVGGTIGFFVGGPAGAAAGAAIGGSAGSSYDAYRADKSARNWQKKQQAEQNRILKEQQKEALNTRKAQINQMREQIATGGSYQTNRTSEKGIVGKLNEDILG